MNMSRYRLPFVFVVDGNDADVPELELMVAEHGYVPLTVTAEEIPVVLKMFPDINKDAPQVRNAEEAGSLPQGQPLALAM